MKISFLFILCSSCLLFVFGIVNATSQVIYTDVIPDDTLTDYGDSFYLDLNHDAIVDYLIEYNGGSNYCSCSGGYQENIKNILPYNGNEVLDSNNYPLKLNLNDTVAPTSMSWNSNVSQVLIQFIYGPPCTPNFCTMLQALGTGLAQMIITLA